MSGNVLPSVETAVYQDLDTVPQGLKSAEIASVEATAASETASDVYKRVRFMRISMS